jgi:two-component system, cell cycle response regulator
MRRIAVVNDDTVFLEMMASVLAEQGYETEIYRETDGAFESLQRSRPDLIILDIRMERPENGWTLLELLILDRVTSTVPVIVCSAAVVDLREREDWLAAHGIAILPKPFDIKDLYQQVELALVSRTDSD